MQRILRSSAATDCPSRWCDRTHYAGHGTTGYATDFEAADRRHGVAIVPAVAADSGNGKREETAKYYHVFQNGACYEFALKVATNSGKVVEGDVKDNKTEAAT